MTQIPEQGAASSKVEPAKSDAPTAFSKVLSVLAYPLAAIPGIFVAKAGIRDAVHETYTKSGTLADIQNQFIADQRAVTGYTEIIGDHPTNNRRRDLPPAHPDLKYVPKETKAAVKKLQTQYYRDVEKRLAEKWHMHNVFDYWENMHINQKINTAFLALTASGVALGALLTIANSPALSKLKQRQIKNGDQSPER